MDALVLLGGGGARGAVQIRPIEYIWSHYKVTGVGGTSVGAINGAAVASRKPHVLRPIWSSIRRVGDFTNPNAPDIWRGVHSLRPIRTLLRRNDCLDFQIPFGVGVFDPMTATPRTLHLNPVPKSDREAGVLCSASIPFMMETHKFQGQVLDDGGVDSSIPDWPPPDTDLPPPWEYDSVHVVLCAPLEGQLEPVTQKQVNGAVERLGRAIDYLHRHRAMAVTRRRLRRWKGKGAKIVLYEPRSHEDVGGMLEASAELTEQRLKHGRWLVRNRREF